MNGQSTEVFINKSNEYYYGYLKTSYGGPIWLHEWYKKCYRIAEIQRQNKKTIAR